MYCDVAGLCGIAGKPPAIRLGECGCQLVFMRFHGGHRLEHGSNRGDGWHRSNSQRADDGNLFHNRFVQCAHDFLLIAVHPSGQPWSEQ
jgi:hypothetical protein